MLTPFLPLLEVSVPHTNDYALTLFFIQILLMLLVGRLLSEAMHRIGQPAVIGQLLGGILLGPSVLGNFFPHLHHAVFPASIEQKKMLDAVAQLGVLMLLLLTGMETDLGLAKRLRKTALFTSLGGILLPFICGFTLGQLLPEAVLPNPSQRLITSLFLATALSISSVKIVAMVLIEVDFMRRNIGQIILASAILDDTIGWIIIALIGGLAANGEIRFSAVAMSVVGTLLFLALSFTIGQRLISFLIRWVNDNFTVEMPVITTIVIVMLLMSLLTEYIGVHTVLGAFVTGILVGQSPILTKHIEGQLRGLIVALFMPVFFAVAGLSIDLRVLENGTLALLAIGLIAIASFGKIVGCYVGGRLGHLTSQEASALALGMNARGSTEVIVATIGLGMGVLTQDLYTLIVVMAISTTLITPPLLRWALRRIPPTGEEKERLDREQAEAKDFVPKVQRILVAVQEDNNGTLASLLAGYFAGTRKMLSTVVELKEPLEGEEGSSALTEIVKQSADTAAASPASTEAATGAESVRTIYLAADRIEEATSALLDECKKGYDLLFFGIDAAPNRQRIQIPRVMAEFPGLTAIALAHPNSDHLDSKPLNILVPTIGTDYSRKGAELAIAVAKGCSGIVHALYVAPPPSDGMSLRTKSYDQVHVGREAVNDIQRIGIREGVSVKTEVRKNRVVEGEILRVALQKKIDLMILGVKTRPGAELFFGKHVSLLRDRTPCALLIVSS